MIIIKITKMINIKLNVTIVMILSEYYSPYKRVLPHWFPHLQILRFLQTLDTDQDNHNDDDDQDDDDNDDDDNDVEVDEDGVEKAPECSWSP